MGSMVEELRGEGRGENLIANVASPMDTLKLTSRQAMEALKVPGERRAHHLTML